jgi:hypothetical protein
MVATVAPEVLEPCWDKDLQMVLPRVVSPAEPAEAAVPAQTQAAPVPLVVLIAVVVVAAALALTAMEIVPLALAKAAAVFPGAVPAPPGEQRLIMDPPGVPPV